MKIYQIDVESQTEILRDPTKKELAQYEADEVSRIAAQSEAEAKATARQAILDRLGLTADEAALILG
jgi:hypothetical protein